MKSKKLVFEALKLILQSYESYKKIRLGDEKAEELTLDKYSDFYEWLNDDKNEIN